MLYLEPRHCAPQLILGKGLMSTRVTVSYEISLHLQTSVIRDNYCVFGSSFGGGEMRCRSQRAAVVNADLNWVLTYASYFHLNADNRHFILHPYSTITLEFLHPAIL